MEIKLIHFVTQILYTGKPAFKSKKVECALSDFCLTFIFPNTTKIQQEPCAKLEVRFGMKCGVKTAQRITYMKNRFGKDYHKIETQRKRLERLVREYMIE